MKVLSGNCSNLIKNALQRGIKYYKTEILRSDTCKFQILWYTVNRDKVLKPETLRLTG